MLPPEEEAPAREIAPAKLNLALHVRGRRPDGRHDIETVFAFCTDGDRLSAVPADAIELSVTGPFAVGLEGVEDNLVLLAALALQQAAGVDQGAHITLHKQLPVASGIGGGSADAAATLRLLTSLWHADPAHAIAVAPGLGSDVLACLLSLPMRGEGAGDLLSPLDLGDLAGKPVLLVNPLVQLLTTDVFGKWDGKDGGPLGDWREGRNDLQPLAVALVPQIANVLDWLENCDGATLVRMSGSGATCFAFFESDGQRDLAASAVPTSWWHLATHLR